MVDKDSKKPFTIPKTHTSSKDVLIPEKTDSRNVTDLYNDLKACALEVHFDFRQNECQSCDTIRNPKLQKLFNARRIQMKKSQDPTERFAFHLITSRDSALDIATNGLTCEQLSFSIDKYLGNPKDGIHLSRRPDVLLASTGSRGLHKFGLLICKILLGKGYATIPSENNKQLSAQLHYDYHFCKIQTFNKEQRHIDKLLANSLIFCYEHGDLEPISQPTQILPIAILWYDLKEKFSSELLSIAQESQQQCNGKTMKLDNSYKIKPIPKPILTSNNGTWDPPIQDTTNNPTTSTNNLTIQTTPTKYPSQFMIPYPTLYTSFSNIQPQSISNRDPRLTPKNPPSETIPLSPQDKLLLSSSKQLINIPLNSTSQLIDPRLQTLKQTHDIFYLETKAVKHALQQQKRLNNYCNSKNGILSRKTTYILIPFFIQPISLDEYERMNKISKYTPKKEYSSLHISVTDCFHFGFNKTDNEVYIDLEENQNQLAYEQIKISNQLIEHEKHLNYQERRLHLREKRQKKLQNHVNEPNKYELPNSKVYIDNGRKLLKQHQTTTSSYTHVSLELLDFFSYEYQHETRPHVKRILAELLGIFVEKYGLQSKETIPDDIINNDIEVSFINDETINSVIDMDLESPSSQTLGDYDERFSAPTPPITESTYHLPFSETSSNQTSDNSGNNNNPQSPQIELSSSEFNMITDDNISKENTEQNNDSKQITIADISIPIETDMNHSCEELTPILTKETDTLKLINPSTLFTQRRRSYDDDELKKLSTTRAVTLDSSSHEDNSIADTTNVDQQQQPTVKRIRVDSVPLSNNGTNPLDVVTNNHGYHQDCDERRRQEELSNTSGRSRSQSTSSYNSSSKESITRSPSLSYNRYQQQQQRNDYEHNRSYDRSNRYSQRNMNKTKTSRHQRFNYNHQSVAEHPRFINTDAIPPLIAGYKSNLFNTSNNLSSNTNINRNHNASYYNETSSNPQYYQDNYDNNLIQPPPLMSTNPIMNFNNSFDPKPSTTIERLQMLLQDRTKTSHESRQSTRIDYSSSSSYMMNSQQDNNNSQWSSSQYSSSATTNTNPQTFSYNDAEQLLSIVQNLRN
ncbi:unnamed protein product [Adineta steineri]|uniref:Uncharacterized protein n=1 Tax=Adineta steineri TaxID=433720 RepID=A0A818XBR4_9BILA|nr:unnamed protein product [Adineta steineri]CAF3738132.1 unnamed protein product [Adineta steineri]